MGNYLGEELRKMQERYPCLGDVRQAGLHIGVELVKDPVSKEADEKLLARVRSFCMDHGVLFGVGGILKNVLKIKPPFIINRAEADTVLNVLAEALAVVSAQ
jgi:4-aminobutyrate aminotransferase-like enzyme